MAKYKEEREEWKSRGCCGHRGTGKLIFGLFLLLIGVSWLGTEMGWWNVALPWLPLAITFIGASLLVKWVMYRD
ncbi:MAG: hypothetical protein V1881_03620 [Candidatus Micrarchaeota archaeon]